MPLPEVRAEFIRLVNEYLGARFKYRVNGAATAISQFDIPYQTWFMAGVRHEGMDKEWGASYTELFWALREHFESAVLPDHDVIVFRTKLEFEPNPNELGESFPYLRFRFHTMESATFARWINARDCDDFQKDGAKVRHEGGPYATA